MNESQRRQGKEIHRETGKTFYYATRVLPERIREQTYVLYGFFRIADEVVDDGSDRPAETRRTELERIREVALGNQDATEPVVEAFSDVRENAGIPDEEVDAFIDAMLADIDTDRYETYDDLEGYMRGSAAAVGNMMLAVIESDHPEKARPHAMALGNAFQLTNFIRDVREDIRELDRVYLPQETLRQYDVTVDQLRREECTPGLRQAVKSEVRRAEQLYRKGVSGIEYLPRDCQFAVVLAAVLYAEHHRLIRKQEFDVLSSPPSLSRARKLWVVARTWWNWRRFSDPVTVFRRVSAVPADDGQRGESEHGIPSPK
ncbi:MAG: phytoene/squalene synthase family protein [Halovenus sp.]